MPRKLTIATGSALLLCVVFLALAVLIGGDDIFHDARSLDRVKPLIDAATHKAWRWNGGDTLALDAPINIRYRPTGPARISVRGPADLLEHVQVAEGRIGSDIAVNRGSGKKLEALVSGVPIRKFVVNGHENLDLGEIHQASLDLHINSSGVVRGRGAVERLNLVISGSGKADLGALSVGDAKVSILGSGEAALSPHGKVKVLIAGSGDLQLLTAPTELTKTILGSGEVNQLSAEAARNALKSLEASRLAADAARDAMPDNDDIDRAVTEAVRRGLDDARIAQKREGRMPPPPPVPPMSTQDAGSAVLVRGGRDTDLGHVEQPSLKITVANSGSVAAEGKVDDLQVTVLGSGHARLGKLAARHVSVVVAGSGSATVAPSDELSVTISGSGDVHLLTHPARIQQTIRGSGRIIEEH